MKKLIVGENTLYFNILRDSLYFQPTTNYYGVVLKSWDNNKEKTFIVRDISPSPKTFQQFGVTGTTGTESLSEGVISIKPYGTYYYSVYGASGATVNDVQLTFTPLARGQLKTSED